MPRMKIFLWLVLYTLDRKAFRYLYLHWLLRSLQFPWTGGKWNGWDTGRIGGTTKSQLSSQPRSYLKKWYSQQTKDVYM